MSYYDCDETDRAVDAYFAETSRLGHEPQQPNRHRTERQGDVITVANSRRVLARYAVRGDGRLRRLTNRDRTSPPPC
jgi:hypothetical protein